MALLLSLETSTKICSVAVHFNSDLISSTELHIEQSHASRLAPLIEATLKVAGVERSQLNAVVVSSGPGSYTGLRIGVSTSKGLCYALRIPLIAVNTLDLMAYEVSRLNNTNTLLCPMIDARRMEVYCKVTDNDLKEVLPVEARVIDENTFKDILQSNQIYFFGDGSRKCQPVISHSNAGFLDGIYPKASLLGKLGYQKLIQNNTEDLVSFEPFYLKQFFTKALIIG
jgi:tRNA threonylcarbamoyladenosine biosynthesis protein TsaB